MANIQSKKAVVLEMEEKIAQKEAVILQYQTLMKKDRDEHSLAAARMQEEVRKLQNALATQEQHIPPENTDGIIKPAISNYIQQVKSLEQHSNDVHNALNKTKVELNFTKTSCEEWKQLAESRQEALQKLTNQYEVAINDSNNKYKQEYEKWKTEISKLKELLLQYRMATDGLKPVKDLLQDKEHKIFELMTNLRQVKNELKKRQDFPIADSNKLADLETDNIQLNKENESLKKKYEQLLKKEKSSREQIRTLNEQLLKRPPLSARSGRSNTSNKEIQLQKKITTFENKIKDLQNQLDKQISINESHKVKVNKDFDKWNKTKHWQLTAEKYKTKLREKENECKKAQQTCSSYKILIEKIEREKNTLECQLKFLRTHNRTSSKLEALETENNNLHTEIINLTSKLEMHQYHAGGLGAAMLQEKLEAQERKIAVLELSSKGSLEVSQELERLQSQISVLQKTNLRLEAENVELNLDLQKVNNESPHLREQIYHLENYIEVLKAENSSNQDTRDKSNRPNENENTKVGEMERTILILRRLVEKLQVENKRMQSGRHCSIANQTASEEKLRNDLRQLKIQYGDTTEKNNQLQQELQNAILKLKKYECLPDLSNEVLELKSELLQKTQLLEKVKTLLHRAAVKEKSLLLEVENLKHQLGSHN